MSMTDNDRIQEMVLLLGDKFSVVRKIWWYALMVAIVGSIPGYYLVKAVFVSLNMASYDEPNIIYSAALKEPLQILEKKIFEFPDGTYSGYVRLKNINVDWGVAEQGYTAEFKTFGNTVLTKVERSTFILPASEKLIIFSRFTATGKPDQIDFTLNKTNFLRKPNVSSDLEPERISLENSLSGLLVRGAVQNNTAFTISQVNLPVAVFDSQNRIVAVNFTYINDLLSGETRTFQYSWPAAVAGALRAEINPEINIFDRDVYKVAPGISPFDEIQEDK